MRLPPARLFVALTAQIKHQVRGSRIEYSRNNNGVASNSGFAFSSYHLSTSSTKRETEQILALETVSVVGRSA